MIAQDFSGLTNNVMPIGEEQCSFTTMVRGRQIRFDREALNNYLGNPINILGDEL
ncbi:hypothetical protein A2U01_0111672, partial [Trifolium medium]|nr:hypothetical protein [Trifolium medium]